MLKVRKQIERGFELDKAGKMEEAKEEYLRCIEMVVEILRKEDVFCNIMNGNIVDEKLIRFYLEKPLERIELIRKSSKSSNNSLNVFCDDKIYSLGAKKDLLRKEIGIGECVDSFAVLKNSLVEKFAIIWKAADKKGDNCVSLENWKSIMSFFALNGFAVCCFRSITRDSLGLDGKMAFNPDSMTSLQFYEFLSALHLEIDRGEKKLSFSSFLFNQERKDFITVNDFHFIVRKAIQLIEVLKKENHWDSDESTNNEMAKVHSVTLFKNILSLIPKSKCNLDDCGVVSEVIYLNDYKKIFQMDGFVLLIQELCLFGIPLKPYFYRHGIENKNSSFDDVGPCTMGERLFSFVIQIMTGISIVIEQFKKVKESERDFTCSHSFSVSFLEKNKDTSVFSCYSPVSFRKIRELSGVSECEFRLSLGIEQVVGNLLLGNLTTLSSSPTQGKSGNMFFNSFDGKFLLKTISSGEFEKFWPKTQSYMKHLSLNKSSTLLAKMFGIYKIRDKFFVALENIFFNKNHIDVIYDLKGSTMGRTNQSGKGAFKDLDFDTREGGISLPDDIVSCLLSFIATDVEWLRGQNIIDYSLLVGIHNITNTSKYDDGGFLSKDKQKIYYFGIIDYLVDYGIKKFAERAFKTFVLGNKSQEISVVDANLYADRFLGYASKIFCPSLYDIK